MIKQSSWLLLIDSWNQSILFSGLSKLLMNMFIIVFPFQSFPATIVVITMDMVLFFFLSSTQYLRNATHNDDMTALVSFFAGEPEGVGDALISRPRPTSSLVFDFRVRIAWNTSTPIPYPPSPPPSKKLQLALLETLFL